MLASHTKRGSASCWPRHSVLKLRRALSKVSFFFFLYSHSWLISPLSGASNSIYMLMVPTFASQTQCPPLLQGPDLVLPIAFCLEYPAGA